ncbi:hypothetical protein [Verrucosispora sp. SN26_14.1]|uniref:hypothetical protein n=1 Tax=Verrucosispora sp. SN26_14.1 TaxID=2527879 RepID=UPI001F2C6CC8|nr:hypothetical protein [Verrucosispora sp. SN26_14.1]
MHELTPGNLKGRIGDHCWGGLLRPSRRPTNTLQLSLLFIAVLLEIAVNFFANDDASPLAAAIRQVAGPALIVLLVC